MRHQGLKGGTLLSVHTPLQTLGSIAEQLSGAAKIPLNEAKKLVYWRAASIRIKDFQKFPGIALIGPSGSGKSTLMNGLRDMDPQSSATISCIRLSTAEARDQLADAYDKTVFCEEFDQLSDPSSAYILFHSRTERLLSHLVLKRQERTNGPYVRQDLDVFGATIVHSRNDFDDPALVSRFLSVHTAHRPGPYPVAMVESVSDIAASLVLEPYVPSQGRSEETWTPVLQVAQAVGDVDWIAWGQEQIMLAQEALLEAAEYDRKSLVLGRIIEIVSHRDELANKSVNVDPWQRINLGADVSEHLRKGGYPDITAWQVNAAINSLGLKTVRSGGRRWLFPTPIRLMLACQQAGYEDEWVEALKDKLDRQ